MDNLPECNAGDIEPCGETFLCDCCGARIEIDCEECPYCGADQEQDDE